MAFFAVCVTKMEAVKMEVPLGKVKHLSSQREAPSMVEIPYKSAVRTGRSPQFRLIRDNTVLLTVMLVNIVIMLNRNLLTSSCLAY